MGHRLTKIYTRTGDDGTTGLGDGSRLAKDAARVRAMGSVDETNSLLGLLAAELAADDALAPMLNAIQHDLFDLGGELSIPGTELVSAARIDWLEARTDELNDDLPPLRNFVLPGGNRAAACCHVARAVCRRSFTASTHEDGRGSSCPLCPSASRARHARPREGVTCTATSANRPRRASPAPSQAHAARARMSQSCKTCSPTRPAV